MRRHWSSMCVCVCCVCVLCVCGMCGWGWGGGYWRGEGGVEGGRGIDMLILLPLFLTFVATAATWQLREKNNSTLNRHLLVENVKKKTHRRNNKRNLYEIVIACLHLQWWIIKWLELNVTSTRAYSCSQWPADWGLVRDEKTPSFFSFFSNVRRCPQLRTWQSEHVGPPRWPCG